MHLLVADFMALFRGDMTSYGVYKLTGEESDSGKKKGRAASLNGAVTTELWDDHLQGRQGLGIIPIDKESLVKFGAIDIDVYPIDLGTINGKIVAHKLPLIPCRTKSGGCHLYMFMNEMTEAKVVQTKLREFAAFLGFGECEIFPKQTKILKERGDVGQWINMPYFDAAQTERYAIGESGTRMTAENFLKLAALRTITREDLLALKIVIADNLVGGPPCLNHLVEKGFPEGTRNNGLFNIGVYCQKSNPDKWREKLAEYNSRFMDPPLTNDEVQGVIKSLEKKTYNYTCHASPIQNHCNMSKCRACKFGVGNDDLWMPKLGTLTKLATVPPVWFISIDGGGRLEMGTDDLQNPMRFQKVCMEQLNVMPQIAKRDNWTSLVQKLMSEMTIIDMPHEATPHGQLVQHIEDFCTSRVQARVPDELLMGKPWTNNGLHYFRMKDLLKYLERQKFTSFTMNRIAVYIRDMGANKGFWNVKGKGVNWFAIPEFKKQTGGFEPPPQTDGIPY